MESCIFVEQLRMDNLGNVPRFHRMLYGRNGVINKWSIILLAAHILSCGGQRPQVYAQLELPQASELQMLSDDCCRNKLYFSLRAGREKTTRSVDIPTVLFTRTILEFIRFNVLTMRPLLVNKILGPFVASKYLVPLWLRRRRSDMLRIMQAN
jgi:hypothetical protein